MKYIITESQYDDAKYVGLSKLMHKLIETEYPFIYDDTAIYRDDIEYYSQPEDGELLFYYNPDEKDFYVGANFLMVLFNATKVDLFNPHEAYKNKREEFNKLIKVFAKLYYGYDVKNVWFHFY